MPENKQVINVNAKVDKAIKNFNNLETKISKFSDVSKEVAKKAGIAFAGLSAAVIGVTKVAGDFEQGMVSVKTLLNDQSFQNVGKNLSTGFAEMKKGVLDVVDKIPISLYKATKSMFDLVSAGIPASDAVKALETSGKLAVAGLTDVSVATDGLTSALNAYKLDASEAETVASKFFAAQVQGKTTIEELASGFGKVGNAAATLKIPLEEVLASVSQMTLSGVKTSEAYTSLNAVLTSILKPTEQAKEEARRLGVEFSASAVKSEGLGRFLQKLTQNTDFTEESVSKLFGSTEAMKSIFALTGENAENFSPLVLYLKGFIRHFQLKIENISG